MRPTGIEVAMVVGKPKNPLQRPAQNQDDLHHGPAPDHMDVVCEPWADNPLVLVAPPSHPLVGLAGLQPQRLKDEPFILREPGSGTRLTAERFCQPRHHPQNRLEVGSNEAIKQTVAGGLG